jgi:hypothetical protein
MTDRSAPVQVNGLTGVAAIAAGQLNTVVLKGGEDTQVFWTVTTLDRRNA